MCLIKNISVKYLCYLGSSYFSIDTKKYYQYNFEKKFEKEKYYDLSYTYDNIYDILVQQSLS